MRKLDFKELNTAELREKITEEKAQYNKMVFNHSISPLENPLSIRTKRKQIARMQTELVKRLKTENN
ncbi:MAG: 50S ribosomal protein L29 [Flavobacteriales bacterium]